MSVYKTKLLFSSSKDQWYFYLKNKETMSQMPRLWWLHVCIHFHLCSFWERCTFEKHKKISKCHPGSIKYDLIFQCTGISFSYEFSISRTLHIISKLIISNKKLELTWWFPFQSYICPGFPQGEHQCIQIGPEGAVTT